MYFMYKLIDKTKRMFSSANGDYDAYIAGQSIQELQEFVNSNPSLLESLQVELNKNMLVLHNIFASNNYVKLVQDFAITFGHTKILLDGDLVYQLKLQLRAIYLSKGSQENINEKIQNFTPKSTPELEHFIKQVKIEIAKSVITQWGDPRNYTTDSVDRADFIILEKLKAWNIGGLGMFYRLGYNDFGFVRSISFVSEPYANIMTLIRYLISENILTNQNTTNAFKKLEQEYANYTFNIFLFLTCAKLELAQINSSRKHVMQIM